MEHRNADARPVAGRGTSGDDPAQFLHELRQLRDGAGLGHAELAARAHYPYDSIRAAEVGPSLPDLPVLSAFVRGCGGTTEEWEERWRSLTKSPSLPVCEARQAHRSDTANDAANAGARINSATQAGDSPDPSIIIAALNRVAEEMAASGADEAPAPPVAPPAPDFPAPSPVPSGPPRAESKAGWDPIRVSSAWPVLKDTPTVAEPAGDAVARGGADVPWGDAAPSASLGPADSGTGPAGSTGSRGSTGHPSRTVLVVVAVVLLCVIVAVLAMVA